ncbi:hypothetical protein [Micromonospora sp. U21]|uniref:hypothetical protein n=1 Tax=Micromonospora sp. U21 TaxID=2824899 RepID=UPI001B36FFA4|nr:hypothetical protein [Micromonospora sp. U21]MBQ0905016.1 hypothetical protein [Micromonospora sp. U21]
MNVTISGSSGFQIGDGNIQINVAGESATVQATDVWWSTVWLPATEPELSSDMVLAGRQAAADALRAALTSDEAIISVSGDLAVMEFKAFLAAALVGSPLAKRAFFVGGATTLTIDGDAANPPILMLAAGTEPSSLPLTGSHKIVLFGRGAVRPDLTVPAVDGIAVARMLTASRTDQSQEVRLGALARRGLEQLRRALSRFPQYPEASWAVTPDRVCRRLSLLGEFTARDSQMLAGFAGVAHDLLEDTAGHLLTDPDRPLFGRLGIHWYLQEPEDAFLLLRTSFTAQDLESFADLAVRVLRDGEPASPVLRRGVTRTLLMLAVHGDDLRYGQTARRGSVIADAVVHEVLASRSPARWRSLTDVIGTIAEAAPGTFLDALSHAPEWQAAMFGSESDYPAFLWALELLARAVENFDEAVDALARLATVDPGGRLSNRPSESLAGVFDCRFPQTRASRRHRQRALRRILQDHPTVGRQLLRDLLPHGGVIRTAHPQPQVRQWPLPETDPPNEVYQAFRDVAALAIDDAGTDPVRCAKLVPSIDAMPAEEGAAFLQALADLPVPDRMPRRQLFEALTDLAALHQGHADEGWALPQEQVDEVARIAGLFRPDHAADRHHWLFVESWPRRGRGDRITGLGLYQARTAAVAEIVSEADGFAALLALADETGHGELIGEVLPRQPDEGSLLSWLTGERHHLAFEYFATQIRNGPPARRGDLLADAGDAARRAAILLASRDERWALEQLPTLDTLTADAYWRGFPSLALDSDLVAEVAAGLCGVHRFTAALELIALYGNNADTAEVAQQAIIAAEGLIAAGTDAVESHLVSRHDLQSVIDLLARHLDVLDRHRVMNIELGFSAELGGLNPRLPVTAELMEEDPAVFATIAITILQGPTRASKIAAWYAVRAPRRCPGSAPDGSVQLAALLKWTHEAREQFAAAGVRAFGDRRIAGVLVHAIPASLEVIGELIEKIRSKDLERGIATALYNRRGMTMRALTDGGIQERTLATHYRDLIDRAQDFPRLQGVLRQLADGYVDEAHDEDTQAEAYLRDL